MISTTTKCQICPSWSHTCEDWASRGVLELHWHNCGGVVGNPPQECRWVELEVRWNHGAGPRRQAWIINAELSRSATYSAGCCGFAFKTMWTSELKLECNWKCPHTQRGSEPVISGQTLEVVSVWRRNKASAACALGGKEAHLPPMKLVLLGNPKQGHPNGREGLQSSL